jgi:hypothetical protein
MANTPSAKIQLDIQAVEILTSGVKSGVIPSRFLTMLDLPNGTLDGNINRVFSKTESSVAASTVTSYDVVGGVVDSFGSAITMAEVVLIAIRNNSTTALQTLIVGAHATNGFGKLASGRGFFGAACDVTTAPTTCQGGIVVPAPTSAGGPGWMVLYSPDGVPAVAATSDVLAVVTSAVVGSTNGWDILILGRSA